MRNLFCVLIAIAEMGDAQERRSGDGRSSLTPAMLAAHNAVRAQVGVAPLSWSDRLAASSQNWADTLLERRQFFHRPNSTFGQNLFEIRGAAASPARVVEAWAAESRNYNHSSNTCRGVCGHYTQIVWSDTKEVGCAVARSASREVWVCEYDPPGNWIGKRPY
jgi:pathogenesis-related protein 1